MKRIITALLTMVSLAVVAPIGLAQRAEPSEPRSGTDVFVGYTNLQAEGLPEQNTPTGVFNTEFFRNRTTLHGFNTSVTGFPSNAFGITGDFSFDRKGTRNSFSNGEDFRHTDVYYFMAGPTLSLRNSSRVEPFVRALAGGAHTRYEVSSRRDTPGGGSVIGSFEVGSTSFAAAAGGGIDLRFAENLKLRLIQVDWAPVFLRDRTVDVLGANGVIQPQTLEGQRQDNVRFSFGLVF
jgi:opacity protein-like surface antigen